MPRTVRVSIGGKFFCRAIFCDSPFSRFRGIMLRPAEFTPLLIPFYSSRMNSIHSLFCPPFSAVFVFRGRVSEVLKVLPNSRVSRRCDFVLEVPAARALGELAGSDFSFE